MADHGQKPLHGLVICCTALPQDVRTNLASVAEELGAIHKLDLTCDVTHLICGSTNTPKYQYTAKERPDIAVLHPSWLEAVRQAWMTGEEVDVETLADQHRLPTFFGLRACLTGFTDTRERENFKDTFEKHGAEYHGDLTKQITHLIAHTASGPKYEHALSWRIHVVSAKWFQDSLQRKMVLDETLYHPSMPIEDQGRGAFKMTSRSRTSLGKRARDTDTTTGTGEEVRKRKLRRSASTRLNADSQDLWQGIGDREDQSAAYVNDQWGDESTRENIHDGNLGTETEVMVDRTELLDQPAARTESHGLFAGACVLMYGFNQDQTAKLLSYLEPEGATVVQPDSDLDTTFSASSCVVKYLLVPHTAGLPLPAIPAGTKLVSQWWVERCIRHRRIYDPELDALSQPLPADPIPGFDRLSLNMTGFDSVDLRQSVEAAKIVGAKYQETLGANVSVLLSSSTTIRYEKAQYAAKHDIPAVRAEWLYDCVQKRSLLPFDDYRIALAPFVPSQTGSPAPSDTTVRRSRGSIKAGELQPQRRSNIRKRETTAALSFKVPDPASAPATTSRRSAPFILDDNEDEGVTYPSLPDNETSGSMASCALKERSPNASPRKSAPTVSTGDISKDKELRPVLRVMPDQTNHSVPTPPSPPESPSRLPKPDSSNEAPVAAPLFRPANELAADLASLISRSTSRENDSTTPAPPGPTKRKNRPLGRNLSGSNARSSCPASVERVSPQPEPDLLGTQIGYQTVDADAHRQLMGKRMNIDFCDHTEGQRVASVGTVKDSGGGARSYGGEGRRERHRAR